MKKIFIITILLLCFAINIGASFIDIDASLMADYSEYINSINFVSDNNIMDGDSNGYFHPNDYVTRGMAVQALFNLSRDTDIYTCNFTDVTSNSDYYNAIGWAVENSIASGITDTTFCPDNNVTKEQLMVMFFRYASHYEYDTTIDISISGATDYSLISSSAIDAVTWAYSYGILTWPNGNYIVNPQSNVSRKDMAKYLSRFWTNVCVLKTVDYKYSFINSEDDFVSYKVGRYLISQDDYNQLITNASNDDSIISEIKKQVNKKWGGSCYGMALSCILDNIGATNINGLNYTQNCAALFDIPTLDDVADINHFVERDRINSSVIISKSESIINYYQLLQYFPNLALYRQSDNNSEFANIIDSQQHSGLGLLSYSFDRNGNTVGHAVVVCGKPTLSGNTYTFKLYDSRRNGENNRLQITVDGTEYTGMILKYNNTYESIISLKYINDDTLGNSFDDEGNFIASGFELTDNTCLLSVQCDKGAVITNNSGEEIVIDENGISGDMDIIESTFIVFGEDTPVEFLFLVDKSSELSCVSTNNGSIMEFGITSTGGTETTSAYNSETGEYDSMSNVVYSLGLNNEYVCTSVD